MLLLISETKISLRINASRLGTVSEVRSFLIDIENVYNAFYILNQIEKGGKINRSLFLTYKKHISNSNQIENRDAEENASYDLKRHYALESFDTPSRVITKMSKQVALDDRLFLLKINVQSPGFWEFLGTLSPLTQIREFLKDRHERKKDVEYRNEQEKRKVDLENTNLELELMNKTIDMMIKAGYSQEEIRESVSKFVYEPLKRLGNHQDSNLIEAPEGPPTITGVSIGQIV